MPREAEASALVLHLLTPADADACVPLSAAAGWGHTRAEWADRLTFGVGVGASVDGQLVAAGVLLPASATTAYFGLLLTLPGWRGQGLGAKITERALALAAARGIGHVALFAVQKAVPLYRRLGFNDLGIALESFWRDAAGPSKPPAAVRALDPVDWQAAFALDTAAYGADRRVALSAQVARNPARALAIGPVGAPIAYGLAQSRTAQLLIGPIVAPDAECALHLVDGLLAEATTPVRLDSLALPDPERRQFSAGLSARGFAPRSTVPLMIHGESPVVPFHTPERLFAAQSAATG
jgi:GNAT superfamily N-acetyltransferase